MRSLAMFRWSAAALVASSVALHAQVSSAQLPGNEPAPDAAPPPPKATPAPTPALANQNTRPSPNDITGLVERLPPTAYPSTRIRGIYGGSLWLVPDFHGMQWPYYPKTGIGISGSGWVDTTYDTTDTGEPSNGSQGLGPLESKQKQFGSQSRFVLRATPTWSDGRRFVQGQVEFVGANLLSGSQSLSNATSLWTADDAWVRFGIWNTFDVTVGRFLGWEVYHDGMGLDLHTNERSGANSGTLPVPAIYGVTQLYDRSPTLTQAAVHLYPLDYLRFELQLQYGPNGADNAWGARPVGILDFGWFKLKAGFEYEDSLSNSDAVKDETRSQGFGGSTQFIVDPYVEFGFNGAYLKNDTRNTAGMITAQGDTKTYSVGAFANARVPFVDDLIIGGGINYTKFDDNFVDMSGRNDEYTHLQPFGAIQYLLFKQLFIKAVVAYARADLNPNTTTSPTAYENELLSGRLRLLYLF